MVILLALLAGSCAMTTTFTREPVGKDETLVIGRILFDCQLTRTGSIPIGKYTCNEVNNLGYIVWTGDMRGRTHKYTFNKDYDDTRTAFAERYPKSLWIQREWVNIRGE